ncbi:MAG: hypothetical protein EBR30_20050, partial [Cytophagia bacterium]|nr:hypothetical protein [Cytophagia bacterium]
MKSHLRYLLPSVVCLLLSVGSSFAQSPTQNPTGFTVSAFTSNSLTLTWSNVADANRTNYVILANTTGTFTNPVSIPVDDTNLGDGTGAFNVSASTTTYQWNTGLSSATVYYFKIFAYNSTGPAFLTSGAPTANRSTLSAEPVNQATSLTFTNLGATSYDVGFTAGASDPDGYLVIRRTNSSPTGVPVDGTTYTVGDVLGDGTIEFIGAIGSIPFNDAGLTAATTYHYDVYAYNGSGAAINYLTTSPLEGSRTTLANEPANQPTAPVFSGVNTTTLTLDFTQAVGTPDGYIIIRKSGSSPTAVPVDGVTYAVDAVLGDGTIEFVGAFGTLNDASLTPGTVYHYDVFAYNGSGASINYLTTSPLEASRTTWTDAPANQPTAIVFSNATENSLDVSFTAAASPVAGYIAVRRAGAAPTTNPGDGVEYAEGDVLGDGVVVYIGTAVNFSDAGLNDATTYHYKIYSFNGSTGSYNYLTGTAPLQGSSTTLAIEPADQPTALNFTSPTSTGFNVNYTAAASTPAGYIALRRTGSSPVDVPVDGTTYTAGNTIGASTVAFVGSAVTFNQTGLTEDTQYFYDIFSYNGSGATLNYNTISPLEGNRFTIEATEPASASTTLVFSNITNNVITLNFTNGPGESRIVVIRQGSAVSFTPTDGNSYAANADYSAGTEVGTVGQGNKVVGTGSGPFTITGLNGDEVYHVAVFELNGTVGDGSENYRTSSSLTGSRSTEPTTQASVITFSSVASTTMTVSWTNGNGDRRIVVAKQGAAVDADPTDFTSYTANAAFGSGTQIGSGNRVIYDGTGNTVNVTSLSAGAVYHFAVYEYNGAGTTTAAYLTPAAVASRSTLATQPSNSPNNINFATVTSTSFTVNFGANSGGNPSTGFIAVRRVGAYATTPPVDGTTYTVGDVLGNGEIAYVGSTATFNQSSLTAATNYYYRIYSFAGTGSSINYKDTAPLEGNQATLCAAPTTQASNLTFSLVSETQMQVNWTRGNGDQVIVFARAGAFSVENPSNGTSYTADPGYGAGTPTLIVSGENYYPVYVGTGTNVTVTDLAAVTSYNFKVYEFNNTNVCYNTTITAGVNQVSQATIATAFNGVLTTVSAAATLSSIANTSGGKMPVLRFNVDDDGLDSSPTRITSLVLRPGTGNDIDDFRDIILGADLTDEYGNTQTANITIAANTITITNIPTFGSGSNSTNTLGRTDDNDDKDYILNIWLKTTIGGFGSTNPSNADGRNLTLSLAEADIVYYTSGVTSSELTNGTVIQSGSTNGAVSVVATAIRVTQQPSAAVIATQALATQPIFEATDVNNNRDLGFNNALTVSTSNPDNLGGNSAPANFVAGVANFTASGFNFPNAGSSGMRVTANAINSAYTNSITVSTNTAVAEIFGGIAGSPLSSSSTNQAVLGFSLTTTGASHDFTALTVNSDVDLTGELTNIRLVSSSTNNYSTGTLSTLATATPGTVLNFTGFTTSISGTASYYFIVADVAVNVSNTTPSFTLTLTPNTSNLAISSGSGVSGVAFTSTTYSFQDVTPPTIVSITASADPFNTITPSLRQTLTIVFSEAMSQCGVSCLPTFAITSANWSIFSSGWVNATTFEVVYEHDGAAQTLTPETFTVNAGNARDLGNNLLAVGGTENFVLDTRYPSAITIAVSTAPVNVGPPAALTQTVTVTYDEAMNPATTPSIIFTPTNNFTSVPGSWSVGNTVWTQTFTHNGTVETRPAARAVVNNGGATDAAGNADIGGNSPTFVIDTRPPVISSINSSNANSSYTTGAIINIRVAFDQNIVLTGSPTLTLNTGATATFVLAGSSFIDFSYTVGAGENTNDLDVTSFNLSGATVLDVNGNAANLALPANPNRLIDNKNIRIDTQAPTITSVSTIAADGSYNVGDIIDIQVSFSENVIVTSLPQLALNSGGFANYLSGSGSSTLTFRYTVASGQNTSDLDYINTGSLTLPGTSSIRDIVSINAVLTLPTPGALNSISDDKAITIDTVVPTVSSTAISPATILWVDGNANNFTNATSSQTLTWTVTFSENVTGVDITDFSLNRLTGTDLTYGALGVSGSGAVYTITLNDVHLLQESNTAQLALNVIDDNSITDVAGNPLGGTTLGDGALPGVILYPANPLSDVYNDYFTIIFPEPSNAATNFNTLSQTPFSLEINWDVPVAPLVPANYYLIQIKESGLSFPTPVDGQSLSDNDISDGTFSQLFSASDPLPVDIKNFFGTTLRSGINYDIRIISTNKSGLYNSQSLTDYRLGSVLTGSTNTTTAPSAQLTNINAPVTINSLIDTQGEAVDNFKFRITDETADMDNAPFKFSAITIFQGTGNDITDWTEAIGGAELSDGTNTITASSITNNQIIFTGIASTGAADFGFISDGLFKVYTLRIWLKNNLGGTLPATIDGLNFVFAVNSSSFTYNNTSNNQLSTTVQAAQVAQSVSTTNAVDVVASQLVFRTPGNPGTPTQPQAQIGVASNFPSAIAPKVHALDANNNLDINYAESIIVNNTNALTQSTTHTAFLVGDGGILTLSDYSLDAPGTTQIRVIGTGATTVSQAVSTNVTAVMTNLTQITAGASPEPASISSLSNTILTAVDNFDFTITDDAGANNVTLADNDGLPTRISEIRITQGAGNDGVLANWTHAIASAILSDGVNTHAGTINATEIVFTGLNNTASGDLGFIDDDDSKTYRLRIVLKGPVGNPVNASIADLIDNEDFEFSISNANVTIEGNDKSSALQSSSTSSGNGNNTVTVVATQLDFTTQPNATQNYDAPIINAPSLVVKARDVNGNLDSDYAGTPTLTSVLPGTYPLANTNLTNNNGIITFNSLLKVTSAGNGPAGGTTSLLVSSPGLTTAQSITFTLNYSNASDLIKDTGFGYLSNIQYINHLTAGSGVELERFLLRDGGAAANDTDGTATVLNSITLAINNWENLSKLALYDGGTELVEIDVPGNINTTTGELTISGFEFSANDGASNDLTIKASFLNTVDDNEVISFTVVNVGARNVTSSQFANTNPVGIASTLSVDENRLEVITTKIDFLVNPNPTNISTFTNINNPYMVLGARDPNNNIDKDYIGTLGTVTNSLGLSMSNQPTGNFVAGLYDFATLAPNFQFLQDGNNL